MVDSTPKPKRGRPSKSFEHHGQTRDALIRAGMELLTSQGFAATGIDAVLKVMGVPKGSFYHYFGSKEQFGHEVLEAYDAYICRKLDRWLLQPDRTSLERLLDFVRDAKAGVERYEFKRGCLVGNLAQEVGALPEGFRDALDGVLRRWQARVSVCLTEGQKAGEIAPDLDCEVLAEFFWIGWEGAILRSRVELSPRALDTFAGAFVSLVRR